MVSAFRGEAVQNVQLDVDLVSVITVVSDLTGLESGKQYIPTGHD